MTRPNYNQRYWYMATKQKLQDFIAHPENYPNGLTIDHLYFETLRKLIFLLWHPFSGLQDAFWGYEEYTGGNIIGGNPKTYTGLARYWTADPVYGKCLWENKSSIDYQQQVSGPPLNIHPENEFFG